MMSHFLNSGVSISDNTFDRRGRETEGGRRAMAPGGIDLFLTLLYPRDLGEICYSKGSCRTSCRASLPG
jgi:hypothetical protein